jgi:hypothetical protein
VDRTPGQIVISLLSGVLLTGTVLTISIVFHSDFMHGLDKAFLVDGTTGQIAFSLLSRVLLTGNDNVYSFSF